MVDNDKLRSMNAWKNIPGDLGSVANWICWKAVEKDPPNPDKFDKIPLSPFGGAAAVDNPETWSTFSKSITRWAEDLKMTGIGFVFSENDPFAGVDLDNCRDPKTGLILPWATEIIRSFRSYSEVSPSGTGVKIICRGSVPSGGNRHGNIEMYHRGRFFTVTGRVLDERSL